MMNELYKYKLLVNIFEGIKNTYILNKKHIIGVF